MLDVQIHNLSFNLQEECRNSCKIYIANLFILSRELYRPIQAVHNDL